MPENVFRPIKKGKIINNAISATLDNGQILHGWENISITKNLDAIAHGFSMDITDKWRQIGEKWVLKPGAKITIRVGDELFLTGFIDALNSNLSSTSRKVSISGRSLAGDLVDCSTKDKSEFNDISLTQLTRQLIAPFNIKVSAKTSVGDNFTKFSIEQGDTIFDTLERAARLRAVMFISNGAGNIEIVRAGTTKTFSELHQGVNIISGTSAFNNSDRFSEYTVKGQSQGTDSILSGKQASAPVGTAKDNGIARFRPMVIVASGNVDDGKARTRAQWEASVRAAKGASLSIQTQDWRQENGEFWDINELVHVHAGHLGVNDDFLISGLSFTKGLGAGTLTNFTLVRKDAFNPQPVIEKKADPVSILGPLNSVDKTKSGSTGNIGSNTSRRFQTATPE